MRAANIKTIKKNEQELKTIKNLEQIHSGKNIKNAKNGIISKDNVKLFKKNKRFNKMQTEDIIEELEVKRSPNYISIEKNVEANKLEKSKSSSFLPQSYIQVKFINIKEKIYEFAKYHETKTLKRINSQIQAIKDYQKLMEINDEPIYQAKTFKTRPKIKDQRSIKKSFRRLDSPFQGISIIKSRSITHTKTSPTKLCNTNTTNKVNINQKRNNQDISNLDGNRPNIIPNYENILNQIIYKKDGSPKLYQINPEIRRNEAEIKKVCIRKSNSITNIVKKSKRINKIKKGPIIKQFYEQEETVIIDNEYRKKKSQGKKNEAPNSYFKIFIEKNVDSTNNVDNETTKKNNKKNIRTNMEQKLKKKISDESFISTTDSKRRDYQKKGSFSDSESESENNECIIGANIKTYTYKKKINNNNNEFIYDSLKSDINNKLLDNRFQFLEEITTEFINNKKISYLTKNITDFYNKYTSICNDDILIDKNRYPLPKFPKISVIIPLYNATKFLHYSLRSVQNQKMKEIEIILVEDCSTDDTLLLINKYMKEDPRIRLIKNNKNRKILYSKSIGALNANGKYILQLDQDDLFIRDDLFDILFNEAENNNLDLVQIKDITTNSLYLADKTKVNCHSRYQINLGESFESMPTHYETSEQLKDKLYIDGWVFTLWGLLIKTDIYKKAIYYFWPVILNYKFTYYEDYIMTTIIIIFSKHYKFLNNFGLIHLKHRKSAMCVYSEYLSKYIFLFENVLYKYLIKYDHPEDIKIILNILKRYSFAYKDYYEKYPELFKESILQILSNEYLTDNESNFIREELKIKNEDFKIWNSYEHLMNLDEFVKISNYQNSIINNIQNDGYSNQIIFSIIIYCIEFKFLKNTINSIQNQNIKSFEIIIIYDNDDSSNLNLIQNYIKRFKNIHLINNTKKKGIVFSYSNAALASNGDYILLLKQGETLSKDNILNILYNEIKKDEFDILEFNLLINNCETIKNNSLSLYRCTHFESLINFEFIKYNKNYINLEQEKELLTNKLIKASFYKNIINKYKIINNEEIIYNYYNEVLLFLFSKERCIFKRINEYGIIHYININKKIFYNLISNNNQKMNDVIYYINFLFENTSDSFEDKKTVLDELLYLLSIIYNKFNKQNDKSIQLIEKFIECEFITSEDKKSLKFYHNSLIN